MPTATILGCNFGKDFDKHRATMILREFGELIGSVEQARATISWGVCRRMCGHVITESQICYLRLADINPH